MKVLIIFSLYAHPAFRRVLWGGYDSLSKDKDAAMGELAPLPSTLNRTSFAAIFLVCIVQWCTSLYGERRYKKDSCLEETSASIHPVVGVLRLGIT